MTRAVAARRDRHVAEHAAHELDPASHDRLNARDVRACLVALGRRVTTRPGARHVIAVTRGADRPGAHRAEIARASRCVRLVRQPPGVKPIVSASLWQSGILAAGRATGSSKGSGLARRRRTLGKLRRCSPLTLSPQACAGGERTRIDSTADRGAAASEPMESDTSTDRSGCRAPCRSTARSACGTPCTALFLASSRDTREQADKRRRDRLTAGPATRARSRDHQPKLRAGRMRVNQRAGPRDHARAGVCWVDHESRKL